MRKLYAAALLGLAASSFAACLFPDLSSFQRNEGSGAGHATGPGSGGAGANHGAGGSGASTQSGSGSGSSSGSGSGGGLAPCDLKPNQKGSPGLPNPSTMISGRCIDAEETNWADYIAFLTAAGDIDESKRLNAASVNPDCAAKDLIAHNPYRPTDYIYSAWSDANGADDNKPVQGVDWCDAYIYCHWWAHKELCGGASGGKVDRTNPNWQTSTEWFYACKAEAWPNTADCYGYDVDAGEVGQTFDVDGSCVSKGMHDMLSNVWEWEDNCVSDGGSDPKDDDCRSRGQVKRQPDTPQGAVPGCSWEEPQYDSRVGSTGDSTGIRCCWAE